MICAGGERPRVDLLLLLLLAPSAGAKSARADATALTPQTVWEAGVQTSVPSKPLSSPPGSFWLGSTESGRRLGGVLLQPHGLAVAAAAAAEYEMLSQPLSSGPAARCAPHQRECALKSGFWRTACVCERNRRVFVDAAAFRRRCCSLGGVCS